ncbi:MAG: pyridoxal phosphate-dependent aminotransferase [Sideroxydans sp.]|nr:pyridoxal phosphate-dependent aminotransferase [Acidithiobacillus sp.]MDD4913315.1 pyridoxal phosphate-dependent aminotransferase [Sideroxydans sp.]
MLSRSDYIEWITQHYPRVTHNLAASGIPSLTALELAAIPVKPSSHPFEELGAALAKLHSVSPQEVLACNGTSQAIWLAYAAILATGEEVLVESPTYAPFADTAAKLGGQLRNFTRHPDTGYGLDVDAICRMISPRTRVVALSNLHNPSGSPAYPAAIAAIAAQLRRQNGFVIIDEVYSPFDSSVDGLGITCRTSRHISPNIVCVSSLSKAFGLWPLRIGWVIGPKAVVERASVALRASTGELSHSWATGALGALSELPALAARAENLLGNKRKRVEQWLAEHSSLSWSDPPGGLFGLVTVPGPVNILAIVESAISEFGVIVAPGCFFGAPESFRLAWSLPVERLEDALKRLETALVKHGVL